MASLKKIVMSLISVGIFALMGYLLLDLLVPQSNPGNSETSTASQQQQTRTAIDLVAVGDSLTEGVGDSTQRGGYVPVVANLLRTHPNVRNVRTANYGHAGDTSSQLLTLLEDNEEAQSDLEEANIITITIGGNDIVRNFRQVGLNGSVEDFETTIEEYDENLSQIFELLNQYNDQAMIYIFGLYNPYHYYFSEFQELQSIFDLWNEHTVQIVENQENSKFVEIDSLFNPTAPPEETEGSEEPAENFGGLQDSNHPYLYEEDLFHPNDSGYQMMAKALRDAIEEDLENTETNLSLNE